ncbi:hypothetical protein SPLC1_S501290 [Arthrospira platensis C1]|uniref:hypothetical protein n=1 Tax=Limnospira fusiformis TaxID=54297 RepID=UPI0002803F1C|nr:hypothetical protein SPLC1_S501290 [Arthrospira platensis C1]
MTPEPAPTIVNCQLITGDTAGLFIRSWGVELTPEPAPTIVNCQLITGDRAGLLIRSWGVRAPTINNY